MKYPYMLYDPEVNHWPVFPDLQGPPFVEDLSFRNPELQAETARDQRAYQQRLEVRMKPRYSWGLAGYLERRDSLLGDCPQMVDEQRFFHLGLDVIVPLGTWLHAPLQAVVRESGYEAGDGNFGGWVLLSHAGEHFEPFFSLYGHLRTADLPAAGTRVAAGDRFAAIGDFHENGNWFYHTHIQVLTQEAYRRGYVSKGYCAAVDLAEINDLCPSPLPLFRA